MNRNDKIGVHLFSAIFVMLLCVFFICGQVTVSAESLNRTIQFEQSSYDVLVGKTLSLKAVVKKNDETAPSRTTVVWSSSDPDVVSVSKKGVVKALKRGTAVITAKAKDDERIMASVTIVTLIPVKKITLPKELTLIEGDELASLELSISPENADISTIKWSSSNTDIVSVDGNGAVKAHKAGKATVFAKTQNKKVSCKITVKSKITSISINQSIVWLKTGQTENIDIVTVPEIPKGDLEYISSDSSIADVKHGIIVARKEGKCTITVFPKYDQSQKVTCIVNVTGAVESIRITNGKTITAYIGSQVKLNTQIKPASRAKDVTLKWKSSNPRVATVSNGIVTAVSPGKAKIVCEVDDAKLVSTFVTVKVEEYKSSSKAITNVAKDSSTVSKTNKTEKMAAVDYVQWKNAYYGVIKVWLGYKNLSKSKSIDSLDVHVTLYDTYGSVIDSGVCTLDAKTCKPGRKYRDNVYYIFSGDAKVKKVETYIVRLHTTDDRTIQMNKSDTLLLWH